MCVGFVFVLNPRYSDRFVLAGVVRRMVRSSVEDEDSIKLGEVLLVVGAVGEMSCCGSTGCFSCRGKQSTSLSSSSLGRSLLLLLLLFSGFIGAVGVSVVDSIKLGEVLLALAVGEMSCCSTGYLSCRGKQSTSSSSSSSSGRSLLLFSILLLDLFLRVSVGDASRLVQLGTVVRSGSMAVGVECHGGLGGIGIGNTMVIGVVRLMGVQSVCRLSTREYVGMAKVEHL